MASKKTAKNETATGAKPAPKKVLKRAAEFKATQKRVPRPAKVKTKAARKKPVHTTPDAVKQALAKSGPVSISVLASTLGVTIPTAKRHLKALGAAVKFEGTTRDRVYSLAAA